MPFELKNYFGQFSEILMEVDFEKLMQAANLIMQLNEFLVQQFGLPNGKI